MKLKGLPQKAYNVLFHTHTVAGIVISFALFIIFYAGSFSIFRHDIYRWENPNARIEVPTTVDLEKVLESVKANKPDFAESVLFTVRLPDEKMPYVQFFGAEYEEDHEEEEKEGEEKAGEAIAESTDGTAAKDSSEVASEAPKKHIHRFKAWINPANNYEYIGLDQPVTTLSDTIYRLHYLGQIPLGLYISGFVALFFFFASVTGILIHWRNLITKFYAFTFRGKWKQIWTNAHTVLGVIGLPFQIMYAVTGALFGLLTLLLIPSAFVLFGGDTSKVLATVRPEGAIKVDKDAPPLDHPTLDHYYQKAVAAFPKYQVANIRATNHGREDGFCSVYFDDHKTINGSGQITYALKDGEVLIKTDPAKKTYTSSVLNTVTKLHFAAYGGWMLKIIYFLLGMITCFMILSGVLLWQEARNNNRYTDKQKRFHHKVTKVYLAICLGLFPATAIIFLANKLVPMEMIGRATYVKSAFFLSWLILVIAGLFWNNFRQLNRNYMLIGGVLSLLVPVVNGLVTGDWLLFSDPYVVGVDIFWIFTGLSAFTICYYTYKKPIAVPQVKKHKPMKSVPVPSTSSVRQKPVS